MVPRREAIFQVAHRAAGSRRWPGRGGGGELWNFGAILLQRKARRRHATGRLGAVTAPFVVDEKTKGVAGATPQEFRGVAPATRPPKFNPSALDQGVRPLCRPTERSIASCGWDS